MYCRRRPKGPKHNVSMKSNVTVVEPHTEVKTIKCELPASDQEKQAKEKQEQDKREAAE